MKLRTPQEIINNLTDKRQFLLSKILETIACELEESFNGSALEIYIDEPLSILLAIKKQLKQAVADKGWCLTIGKCTSTPDGYVTTLILSAINQASVATSSDNTDNFEQQWKR